MKLNNNQLIAVIIGLGLAIAFILGITTFSISQVLTAYNKIKIENTTLKAENNEIKIENKGLWNLIKIKDDQIVCHYTHTEVKSDFRVINKR
ncbi:MAG: hypothetical protein ACK58Q_00060 [Chitinophagales bacterium]|jgi:hypothetical protein